MYTTIDQALEALDRMQTDFSDVDDDIYSDLIDAVILDCDPSIVSEVKRVTRGW